MLMRIFRNSGRLLDPSSKKGKWSELRGKESTDKVNEAKNMYRTLQYSVVAGIWGSIFPIKISSDHLAVDHRFPRKVSSYVLTWLRGFLLIPYTCSSYISSLWHILLRCVDHIYPSASLDPTWSYPFHFFNTQSSP